MIFGVDYAWSHPLIEDMKVIGVQFIVRYLSNDTSKNLTKEEATAANKAGISCAVVWESTADRAKAGRPAGEVDARKAQEQARACGMPEDRPIYFAVDWDARVADQPQINGYIDGAVSVLGRDRVGMYAGYWPLKRSFDAGKITWGWQTYAWSGGLWDSRAHIQQYQNGVQLGKGQVDYNRAMTEDYGQWMVEGTSMALTDAEVAKIAKATAERVANMDGLYKASDDGTENTHWGLSYHVYSQGKMIRQLVAAVAAMPTPDVDEAALAAAIMAQFDPERLAELIATRLGPDVAMATLDELRARLEG